MKTPKQAFCGRAKSKRFCYVWVEERDFLVRILQLKVNFTKLLPKGSSMPRLGSFLRSSGISREFFWSHVGPIRASVGILCCFLGVLGGLLEPCGNNLGFGWVAFLLSWEPCDANLGISWVTLFPLGSGLASLGYLVCESSFLSNL